MKQTLITEIPRFRSPLWSLINITKTFSLILTPFILFWNEKEKEKLLEHGKINKLNLEHSFKPFFLSLCLSHFGFPQYLSLSLSLTQAKSFFNRMTIWRLGLTHTDSYVKVVKPVAPQCDQYLKTCHLNPPRRRSVTQYVTETCRKVTWDRWRELRQRESNFGLSNDVNDTHSHTIHDFFSLSLSLSLSLPISFIYRSPYLYPSHTPLSPKPYLYLALSHSISGPQPPTLSRDFTKKSLSL